MSQVNPMAFQTPKMVLGNIERYQLNTDKNFAYVYRNQLMALKHGNSVFLNTNNYSSSFSAQRIKLFALLPMPTYMKGAELERLATQLGYRPPNEVDTQAKFSL